MLNQAIKADPVSFKRFLHIKTIELFKSPQSSSKLNSNVGTSPEISQISTIRSKKHKVIQIIIQSNQISPSRSIKKVYNHTKVIDIRKSNIELNETNNKPKERIKNSLRKSMIKGNNTDAQSTKAKMLKDICHGNTKSRGVIKIIKGPKKLDKYMKSSKDISTMYKFIKSQARTVT